MDIIAGKYFDGALEANVTFSRARSFFTCDINVHAGRGLTVRGEGEAGDANAAFDDAAAHIAKRLRRYRRRVNEHARDLANRERPQAGREYVLRHEDGEPVLTGPVLTGTVLAEPAHPEPVAEVASYATIIAEAATHISRLSVGEAVMQMDLSNQQAMMFHNSATGVLNVVYRRTDGHVGWIDPSAAGAPE